MFFLCAYSFSVWGILSSRGLRTIDVSVVMMGIVYGAFAPIIYHNVHYVAVGRDIIIEWADYTFIHTAFSFISLIFLVFGWSLYSQNVSKRVRTFFYNARVSSLNKAFYVMFTVSLASIYLYTLDYGGFIGYFQFNRLIRSELVESFERSRFSFLWPFSGFAIISCFGFWGLLLSGMKKKSIIFGFILSFILSVWVVFASAGRVNIVTFFMVLFLSILIKMRIQALYWVLIVSIGPIVGIVVLFNISNLLSIKGAEGLVEYIVRYVSFPFVSFFAHLKSWNFYYFYEVLGWFLFLLPSSITSDWLYTAADINTIAIEGARKGEGGVTGSIPTDMLTYGLMQFHIVGVMVFSALLGWILRVLSEIAGSFRFPGLSSVFLSYVIIKMGVFLLFGSQPSLLIRAHFPVVVILLGVTVWQSLKSIFIRRNV